MKILKLALSNFQGIKELELNFDGAGCSIYGDNATGKTTVYNSVTWLLFGKSSTGSTGFTPKTREGNGEAHNLEHSVTASFDAESGVISFQKTMKEVYKKKRGTNVAEFSGHTIDYYVNGVPVKEKEYTEHVNAICGDAEKAKLLTMPFYFPEQISWQDRRKILLSICGDVTDEEVIKSKGLNELLTFLTIPGGTGLYSVEEFRKIAAGQRKAIQQELQSIPARIDEATKAMPVTSGRFDEWGVTIDRIKAEIEKLKEEKASILANDSSRDTQRRMLAELETERAKSEAEHLRSQNSISYEFRQAVEPINRRLLELDAQIRKEQGELDTARYNLQTTQRRREDLLDTYQRVASSRWDGDEICQTCGQRMPEDAIAEAKAKFNSNRSKKLEQIRIDGQKCSKDVIESLENLIKAKEYHLNNELIPDKEKLEAEKTSMSIPVLVAFIQTDAYKAFEQRKAEILAMDVTAPDTSGIDEMIRRLEGQMASANNQILNFRIKEQQAQRIAELEEREKQLAKQFDWTEKGLFLCDEFVRAKVEMLTDGINGHFKNVKFQLFADQINGGLKETCEVLIPSPDGNMVPFPTANNAARINAGLEIIGILSEAWGIQMPVFVDNAEAVTKITPPGDNQTIRLVVSEKDKVLRLELDAPEGQMDLSAFMNVSEV